MTFLHLRICLGSFGGKKKQLLFLKNKFVQKKKKSPDYNLCRIMTLSRRQAASRGVDTGGRRPQQK